MTVKVINATYLMLLNAVISLNGNSFSPDRMLQGRLFSYADAQRYRLGVNYHQIPVNAPKCPANIYHRDGQGRVDGNHGSTIGYAPNSFGEWAEQQQILFENTAAAMDGVPDFIKERHAKHCYQCNPAYGEGVAKALGMNIDFSDVK